MNLKVIDNFLNDDDYNELSLLKLRKIRENELSVYHNEINKKEEVKAECISEETVRRLFKNYHQKTMNLLKELNPNKVDLYDYTEFHILESGSKFKFPIHDDTPNKLLSGVIYLKPEKNTGTIFYEDKKGNGRKEIEWKQNRAVFFSRVERETWHSYQGDGKSNRIALVYNLMTNNIKEVCKVEKKNYFISLFRYKINPYIYRFFKFTI